MKKIMIFGTGTTSYNVVNSLEDNVEIVAYIDNDKSKIGCYKDSYSVVSPDEIGKFQFDYIIIASQYEEEIFEQLKNLNINEKKIIRFFKWFDYNYNYVKHVITAYHNNHDYQGMITGISYARAAILEDLLKYKFVSLAFPSQDIKYDYKMVEYIINNRNDNKIDYCIIGLSYYSFQYDLLKSSMKNKANLYDFIAFDKEKSNCDFMVENIIFKQEYSKQIRQEIEYCRLDEYVKWETGKKQALRDCNKNYPETVNENKQILKDYLQLLKKNEIQPIIVICPASKYYTEYFSQRIEEEFHSIIREVAQEYNFQFMDYFRSEEFHDDDFQDVSHLNIRGAEKFTRMLNEKIKWN